VGAYQASHYSVVVGHCGGISLTHKQVARVLCHSLTHLIS
jgi:hypothetical protein